MSINKLFSPVFESDDFRIFHAAGRNFMESEDGLHLVENVPATFLDLVYGLNHFVINENEVVLYYELGINDHRYAPVKESFSTTAGTTMTTVEPEFLQHQINFLRSGLSDLMLNEDAGEQVRAEIENEVAILEAELRASKKRPAYVTFRYVREQNELKYEAWRYDKYTHKYYINSAEIGGSNISEHAFNVGIVNHEHRHILDKFETVVNHLDLFETLNNVVVAQQGSIKTVTVRHLNQAYVYRINEATQIEKFERMNIARAIEYVNEQVNQDVSALFSDILNEETKKRKTRLEMIDTFNEMISFLHDQKAMLAEHDQTIPQLKEAKKFLNEEIQDLRTRVMVLEDDEMDRNDGYIDAELNRDYDNLAAGSIVKVDAMQYASSAKTDTMTVFYNSDPYRVTKFDLILLKGEAI